MNFTTMHDEAPSGARVNTTVTLLFEETEPFERLPWRVLTRVDSCPMATSHHATCAEAREHAEKIHGAYMEVHSSPETVEFYAETR